MKISFKQAFIRTIAFTFCVWGLSVFGHSFFLLQNIGLASYLEVALLEFVFTTPLFVFWFVVTLILFLQLTNKVRKLVFSTVALLLPTPIFFLVFDAIMGVNLFEFYISVSLSQVIPIMLFAYPFVLRYKDDIKDLEVSLKGTQLEKY